MSIPKFFQSTDAGAPVLTASAGSLNALLKACLINGYGDKPSAGWELVFENQTNHQLVVRSVNIESDQCCYQFTDNNSAYTTISGYDNWNDNGGINPFNTSNTRYILKRSAALVSGALGWVVIADDKSCWLVIVSAESLNCLSTFFGDYHGFNNLKKHSLILAVGSTTYSTSVAMTSMSKVNSRGLGPNGVQITLGSGTQTEEYGFGPRAVNTVSLVEGDYIVFQPVKLFSFDNNTWRLTGILPGYLFSDTTISHNGIYSKIQDINGLPNQTVIQFYYPWCGSHFINVSEW
ncbi:hypothetical protein [Vitreoscilla stercoraria]|uniref:Uncharacterized protein n=1 Tax=Vitreoscilla stercoraria TaxID=61 RepID=A0ABY4EE62_VITST|nr:hypothetical protein [Vitreoscilla stercoraria]UOO93576.1 hypothetical protein LVJ81_06005 [Vitreoscilla stercoraria]